MGNDMTKIEWTEATWNPIAGCKIVSPGCTNCYAMRQAHRLASNPATPHYAGTTHKVNGKPVWTGKIGIASEKALTAPLRRRKPTMYFVNSMSDLFAEGVPDEVIDRVFAVMALCPQHTFQVLTKRADRMRAYLECRNSPYAGGIDSWLTHVRPIAVSLTSDPCAAGKIEDVDWPLPNVWLGVSVEDQARADQRIPHLLRAPAAIRFVSAEPLLGPVNLSGVGKYTGKPIWDALRGIYTTGGYLARSPAEGSIATTTTFNHPNLDWVIVGGESGPTARPMHPDWARNLRDQCAAANVPFFFKQWGAWLPAEFHAAPDVYFQNGDWMDANTLPDIDVEDDWREDWATDDFEGHCLFKRVSKKAAGRTLDGQHHDAMPEAQITHFDG